MKRARKCLAIATVTGISALGAAAPAAAADVYVTNVYADTVSQYEVGADGSLTPASPATVPAGDLPYGIGISPDGESVFVANGDRDDFGNQFFDYTSGFAVGSAGLLSPTGQFEAGHFPFDVTVTPDGDHAYAPNQVSDNVSQYAVGAPGTLAAMGTAAAGASPSGIVISPDGQSAFVANQNFSGGGTASISQYDILTSGALSPKSPATVSTPEGPVQLAITPDGSSLYATHPSANVVSQYDVAADGTLTPKAAATVAAGDGPRGITIAPDGETAYVAEVGSQPSDIGQPDRILQFAVSDAGLTPLPAPAVAAGDGPTEVALSPDGTAAYATNNFSDTISQYRVNADGTLTPASPAEFATGDGPLSIVAAPVAAPPTVAIGTVVLNKRKGTAKLNVRVSGPGTLRLKETKAVRGATKTAQEAGRLRLPVRAKGEARRRLLETGKVTVKAIVIFKTADGVVRDSKRIKLIKRR